jgi:hypothetical protein
MTFFLTMVDWEETLMTTVFTNPDFSLKGSGAKPFEPYYPKNGSKALSYVSCAYKTTFLVAVRL